MRDIGHEVAPHGIGLLQRRDIARQQQQTTLTVGIEVHRDPNRPRQRTVAPRHEELLLEILSRKVTDKQRLAHQIANVLQHVALCIQAKVGRCGLVEPLNATLRIEQHDTIG